LPRLNGIGPPGNSIILSEPTASGSLPLIPSFLYFFKTDMPGYVSPDAVPEPSGILGMLAGRLPLIALSIPAAGFTAYVESDDDSGMTHPSEENGHPESGRPLILGLEGGYNPRFAT